MVRNIGNKICTVKIDYHSLDLSIKYVVFNEFIANLKEELAKDTTEEYELFNNNFDSLDIYYKEHTERDTEDWKNSIGKLLRILDKITVIEEPLGNMSFKLRFLIEFEFGRNVVID